MNDRFNDKDDYKGYIEDYLLSKKLRLKGKFRCLNPEHDDSNPSMSYYKKGNIVKCFACNAKYDIYELIKLEYGYDSFEEAYLKVKELYAEQSPKSDINQLDNEDESADKVKKKDLTKYFNEVNSKIKYTEYPASRGISEDTLNKFNVGFDAKFKLHSSSSDYWRALIIPTSNNTYTVRNTDPNATKEKRYRKVGESSIFNLQAIYELNDPIFVVEGEIDALSIEEVGGHSISLGSTSNVPLFLKIVENKKPSCTFVLVLDNDEVGVKSQSELQDRLNLLDINTLVFEYPENYKDVNEILVKDKELLMAKIREYIDLCSSLSVQRRRKYTESITEKETQELYDRLKSGEKQLGIRTGFNNLDKILDGGLHEGLYILGAMSAVGKTSFVLQVANNIAKYGRPIIYFSLEMSRLEIISKSISRYSKMVSKDHGYSTRDILSGNIEVGEFDQPGSSINRAFKEYLNISRNIYIFEGIGDIGVKKICEVVYDFIESDDFDPIVVIDYLQVIAPYNERYSDKQNTDKAVLELKRLSRDLKIPVICVSSFNRQSYNDSANMAAFKESGSIEYSADVLMAMQEGSKSKIKDTKDTEELEKQVTLSILKNRNGLTGDVRLKFTAKYNLFEETF